MLCCSPGSCLGQGCRQLPQPTPNPEPPGAQCVHLWGVVGFSSHTWSGEGKAEPVWQTGETRASQHPRGANYSSCVIRDIVLTSRWDGSRSDVLAGFLWGGLVWFVLAPRAGLVGDNSLGKDGACVPPAMSWCLQPPMPMSWPRWPCHHPGSSPSQCGTG